jgi:hypothetical protein
MSMPKVKKEEKCDKMHVSRMYCKGGTYNWQLLGSLKKHLKRPENCWV